MRSLFPLVVLCFAACPTPIDEPVSEPPPPSLPIDDAPPIDEPVDEPIEDPIEDPIDPIDPVEDPPEDPVVFTATPTTLVDGRLCDLDNLLDPANPTCITEVDNSIAPAQTMPID